MTPEKAPEAMAPMNKPTTIPSSEEMYALARTMVDETYNSTVQSINTGFALAAALAWNDSVKVIIQKFIKNNTSIAQMHIVYALVVTLLSAIVFVLTKRFVKPSLQKTQVAPVLLR
jgi:hypothetical protein